MSTLGCLDPRLVPDPAASGLPHLPPAGLAVAALAIACVGLLALLLRRRRRRDVYADLMDQASDSILLLDREGRILEANAQAVEQYGHPLDTLRTLAIVDLRAPEALGDFQAAFATALAGGTVRFETLHRRADGSTFPVEVSSRGVRGGTVVLSFVRDITQRKAQEQEVQHMGRLYAALSQVNQAIVRSPDRSTLLDSICKAMTDFGGFQAAWIGWLEADRIGVAARNGDDAGLLDTLAAQAGPGLEGWGAAGTAIRRREACILNDLKDIQAPWRQEGLAAIAAFPILQGGEIRGALVVHARERGYFGAREVQLLGETAVDISFALDHQMGEERRQAAEEGLQESEWFLQEAQEAGGVGTYYWEIQADRWRGSQYLDQIFGVDASYPRNLAGWSGLVAPSHRDAMDVYVAGILARREAFDHEYPIIRPVDGALRWLHGRGRFTWDAEGRPLALTGVIQDITDRKLAERALRASEEKFSKAFHASPDSVNLNRLADGVYLEVNEGFTRITGYRADEVVGRSSLPGDLGIWVREEDRLRMQEGLRRDGTVVGLEAPFRCKDGHLITGLMSASILEIGGETAVLTITRDISDLKEQAQQLERITRIYAALSQVNQAIVLSEHRQALLDKICEVMVQFGQFDLAWIGWNDPAAEAVPVMAQAGGAEGRMAGILAGGHASRQGQGPVPRVLRAGGRCILNDLQAGAEASGACGYAAAAAFPISQGGEVVGALGVYAREKDCFGPHEVALLEEAAGDISFALDHLASEQRRKEAEVAQARLLHILESSLNEIYVFDVDTLHFELVNRSAQLNLGYPWATLQTMTALDIKVAFSEAGFRQAVAPLVSGRLPHLSLETVHARADGSRYPVETHLQVVEHDGRRYFLAVVMDLTERKEAEETIRKTSVAVEQSPLAVAIADPTGAVEYVNPSFAALTGYRAEEMLGRNLRLLQAPATPPEVVQGLWETLARGDVWVGELETLRKAGEPFLAKVTVAPVKDAAGAALNHVAILEDITAIRKAQAERRELEAKLMQSQKLESLGSLASGIAHDMNNVLGAIMAVASVKVETLPEASPERSAFEIIAQAADRGGDLIKRLLNFARKRPAQERDVDLNMLVREQVELLSRTTLARVRLATELAPDLRAVRGDPTALAHAIMNLCVNALDAMPEGGSLRLRTRAAEAPWVELEVEDTGLGMSAEVLARALDPFFTTKAEGKGTGLGLPLVHTTVQAHGGQMTLWSELGRGTRVTLRLPMVPEDADGRGDPEAAGPATPVRNLRILVVDDDDLVSRSIAELARTQGHAPSTVGGGREALDAVARGLDPDLVVLDLNMPGMNGARTLPQLRALKPKVPVMLVTGRLDQAALDLAAAHPGVAILAKPFSSEAFRKCMLDLGFSSER